MDINLKVSPAELEAKATDFKGVMSQIKTLTDLKRLYRRNMGRFYKKDERIL